MQLSVVPATLEEIQPLRARYRGEMRCQIIHDSLHARPGWTRHYLLRAGDTIAGYGAVAVAGPWTGTRTLFEFYLVPRHRSEAFDFFQSLLAASDATSILTQSNDELLTVMLHAWSRVVGSDRIVFRDQLTTELPSNGAVFRQANATDAGKIFAHHREPVGDWVLEKGGAIVATGGILFHYNPPHGDIYMEVAEPFRRQGLGSYLVQELKRVCYEQQKMPCARCSPSNNASIRTLQKAGFAPCAHILEGSVARRDDGGTVPQH